MLVLSERRSLESETTFGLTTMGKGGDNSSGPTAAKVLNDGAETSGAVAGQERAPLLVTREEMKKHRSPTDAWASIGRKVYDISNWNEHPGGSVIFTHAGDDMTDAFNLFHPASARSWLKRFEIGELADEPAAELSVEEQASKEEQRAFEVAYRQLRAKMIAAGLFKVNYWYYAYKFLSQFVIVGAAAWCAASPTWAGFLWGATLLGLFWQQSGWLCHDVCHNQLCNMVGGRGLGLANRACGLAWGNLAQGFSVKWWKDKHNRHHAVPNVHGHGDALNADPDIDTMPLLAWSMKMAELVKDDKNGRFMVSIQKYSYLPLLCFARIAWLQQGIQYAFGVNLDVIFSNATVSEDLKKVQKKSLEGFERLCECALLVCHHLWVFALCSQRPTAAGAWAFWFLAQAIRGQILFAVTSLGHNGLPVYEASDRPDYWKLQVTTTRNISGGWFMHWLCGGLEYQVDHHLFPMMPRHSLPKAHELIVSFCKEHDIKYNEDNLWRGTADIIQHLDKVATEFLTEFPAI